MESQELIKISGIILFVLISVSVHEAAHALVATWCGDDTAKNLGRLTINPIKHLDLWFSIVIPIVLYLSAGFVFGGAKPVPVNPHKLRHPGRDMALVAVAGPFSNILLAIFFLFASTLALRQGYFEFDSLGVFFLEQAAILNLLLAVFNMIPVPPLDGSRVMGYLLPKSLQEPYMRFGQFGILIILFAFWYGALNPIFHGTVLPMYLGIRDFWVSTLGLY